MGGDPPTPPEAIPEGVAERLTGEDPETLRAVAGFAEALATHEGTVAEGGSGANEGPGAEGHPGDQGAEDDEPPEDWDEDDWAAAVEDVDAPARATLTVKTINDNDYYYYQWREGDEVLSEYVAPVSPSR